MSITVLPSIQIMELFRNEKKVKYSEVVKTISSFNFYKAIETPLITDSNECKRIRNICKDNGLRWTSWGTPFINSEKLNISSLDSLERIRSVNRHKELIQAAVDSGSDAYSFICGAQPHNSEYISDAVLAATDSMIELAEFSSQFSDFEVLIEPLDRGVHKNNTLGPTSESALAIKKARFSMPRFYMAWDSAHVALMKEDLITSLSIAGDTIRQLHLCNAILDSSNPLYGDYHILPGQPGYLTVLRAADTIREATNLKLRVSNLPVAIETKPNIGSDPWDVEKIIRHFLEKAISFASY